MLALNLTSYLIPMLESSRPYKVSYSQQLPQCETRYITSSTRSDIPNSSLYDTSFSVTRRRSTLYTGSPLDLVRSSISENTIIKGHKSLGEPHPEN